MKTNAIRAPLTEGPIAASLLRFALPVLFGNILQSLNGSVNAVWVGHYLGEAALTATSNANAILFLLISSVVGIGMAVNILVGQSIGAKDLDQTKRVVGTSVTFFSALSLLVAVLGFAFSDQMMAWMRTPADALPLAVAYMRVLFLAIPFLFLYTYVMMVLRGAGDSRTPFFFLVISVALDIALNPLFIFGWGPVPRLGIAGSAWATLIAQIVSLLALIGYLYRRKHVLCLHRGEGHYLRIDRAVLKSLIFKGLPIGLQISVVSLSMIMLIAMVNRFGSETSAAYGACLQLWNYLQMPAMAMGMAASSMAAQNVGAGNWKRVDRTTLAAVVFSLLMTGTLLAIIYVFDRQALGLFLPDQVSALGIGQHINLVVSWSFMLWSVSFVLGGIMRSTGAVFAPLAILVVSLWGVRVPFAMLLLDRWQGDAVWWSFPVGAVVALFLSMAFYRFGDWRSAKMLAVRPASG